MLPKVVDLDKLVEVVTQSLNEDYSLSINRDGIRICARRGRFTNPIALVRYNAPNYDEILVEELPIFSPEGQACVSTTDYIKFLQEHRETLQEIVRRFTFESMVVTPPFKSVIYISLPLDRNINIEEESEIFEAGLL